MNLYVLTNSPHGLRDQYFDASNVRHHTVRSPNNIFWHAFGEALGRAGITPHTFDLWNKDVAKPDDILVSINHPGETFLWRAMYYLKYLGRRGGHVLARGRFFNDNRKYFSKRILLQIEPWVSQPYVYDRLDKIRDSGVYTKIYLHCRGYGDAYGFFDYFRYWNQDITSPLFDSPKNKFLCIVNGNVTPHGLWSKIRGKWYRELYGERLQAIRYWSGVPGFDLYGWRWDQMPRHPFYFYYGKYARKAWRGAPEDKTVAMAPYKFAICFENCEAPSWVTEKIYDCFSAGCIPVYYGAPDIAKVVPPECFIDFRKFAVAGPRPADWPGSVFNRESYEKLHKFLAEMPESRMAEYRRAIRLFLASRTKDGRTPDDFVKEILS